MHKTLLLLFSIGFVISCNSIKTTQKAINSGNYDKAISLSLDKLQKNKVKEKNQPYIILLRDAFRKVNERDLDRISFLKKEGNPQNLEDIYNLYRLLNRRQESIKPLLPLYINKEGKNAEFNIANYSSQIIQAKVNLSENLYTRALSLLKENRGNKFNYRKVFEDLQYLDKINPNYKDTNNLIEEAHIKGIDYIYVSVKNETQQIIPKRLEEDLLAIDSYGLNNLWTRYHVHKNENINYDFDLELNLVRIDISPEQVYEKEIIKEKQIKNGYKYLLNDKGNYVKDSLGNKIKVDKFKKIRCKLYRFTQYKSSKITGVVNYISNYNNQFIESFPIESEFIFEHSYANYNGDRRALDKSFTSLINLDAIRFPSSEQMVYDTGKDLKEKLKHIITLNKFRN